MSPPFDVLLRLAPWVIAVVVLLAAARLLRRRTGTPSRLAERYPAVEPAHGTRLRRERVVFGTGYFAMGRARIGADAERLHVRVTSPAREVGTFSVPLDEIVATPDRYPWMALTPDAVRLAFAREPGLPLMVFPHAFERLAEASGGRLRLERAVDDSLVDGGRDTPGRHGMPSPFRR